MDLNLQAVGLPDASPSLVLYSKMRVCWWGLLRCVLATFGAGAYCAFSGTTVLPCIFKMHLSLVGGEGFCEMYYVQRQVKVTP